MESISLENVIRQCGDFNRFQFIHYIFLCFLNFCSSLTGFYYVFGLARPYFRCQFPSTIWPNDDEFNPSNSTQSLLLEQFQYLTWKCEDINGTICKKFVYDHSEYGKTFTEVGNYVCRSAIDKTWLSTAYQIGT